MTCFPRAKAPKRVRLCWKSWMSCLPPWIVAWRLQNNLLLLGVAFGITILIITFRIHLGGSDSRCDKYNKIVKQEQLQVYPQPFMSKSLWWAKLVSETAGFCRKGTLGKNSALKSTTTSGGRSLKPPGSRKGSVIPRVVRHQSYVICVCRNERHCKSISSRLSSTVSNAKERSHIIYVYIYISLTIYIYIVSSCATVSSYQLRPRFQSFWKETPPEKTSVEWQYRSGILVCIIRFVSGLSHCITLYTVYQMYNVIYP